MAGGDPELAPLIKVLFNMDEQRTLAFASAVAKAA
jgi:hypothetical protein